MTHAATSPTIGSRVPSGPRAWVRVCLGRVLGTLGGVPEDLSQTRELLHRWHGGDRKALDTLLERDLEWIRRTVHRQLGDGLRRMGDTGDFVQEAILALLDGSPRQDSECSDGCSRSSCAGVRRGRRAPL